MRKIFKIFILSLCFLLSVLIVGCGNNLEFIDADRPIYPPEMNGAGEIVKTSKDYTLSLNGNFSTIKGIKNYSSGYALPEGFGGDYHSGVKVTATSNGASFYYTNIIDLKEIFDSSKNIIEFEILRNTNDADTDYSYVGSVEITLIDIYDSSNTVSVIWKENRSWPTSSYMLVSCNGAEFGRKNDTAADNCEEGASRPKTGTVFMTNGFSQTLTDKNGNPITNHVPFGFKYDFLNNQVLANPNSKSIEYMVLDVDDPTYMKNYTPFKGFTTGEVYVKVSFTNITQQGELVITQIGGRNLSASDIDKIPNSNLIGLAMDYDYYDDNLFDGVVGLNYNLPTPIAYDEIMGGYDVNISASFDGIDCSSLISNGVFCPDKAGVFVITYSALDANKLEVSRVFHLIVKTESTEILINFSDVPGEEYKLFSWISAPIVDVAGGNGKLKEKIIEYYFNGKKITLNRDNKFYASELGTLQIKALIKDELAQTKQAYKNININGVANLTLNSYIPYGLEEGVNFEIPDFSAIDYSSGAPSTMTKSVFVNGESKNIGDTIMIDGLSEIVIDFYGNKGETNEIKKSYSIKRITGATVGDFSEMFIKEKGSITSGDFIRYNFNETGSDIKMPYALSADSVSIRLSVVNEGVDFDYITVNLKDSLSDQSVNVRFLYEADKTFLALNNGNGGYFKYELPIHMEKGDYLEFVYNNVQGSIVNSRNEKIADVLYDSADQPFVGFNSDAVQVIISVGKISGAIPSGAINIHKVGNQSFSHYIYENGDTTGPEISLSYSLPYKQRVVYNTSYSLPDAYAYDVLQYKSIISVKVTAPSGNVVYESNGKGSEILLSEMGNYVVKYRMLDALSNVVEKEFYIETIDNIAPIITIEGNYNSEYRVGNSINCLQYSVSDNYSDISAIQVRVFVQDTQFLLTDITDKDYIFAKQGYYKIIYYATDEAGNVGMAIREVFAW